MYPRSINPADMTILENSQTEVEDGGLKLSFSFVERIALQSPRMHQGRVVEEVVMR